MTLLVRVSEDWEEEQAQTDAQIPKLPPRDYR
jgi:hypothetical protein